MKLTVLFLLFYTSFVFAGELESFHFGENNWTWKIGNSTVQSKDCKSGLQLLQQKLHSPQQLTKNYSISFGKIINTKKRKSIALLNFICEQVGRGSHTTIEIDILSFVEPLFSYKYNMTSTADDSGKTNSIVNWITVDLNTGKRANLLDFFTKDSLEKALRKDKWVLRRLTFLYDEKPKSLIPIIPNLISNAPSGKERPGFAIYDYDKEKNMAAVRIGFPNPDSTYWSTNIIQLGLWLKPKSHWIKEKLFYMKDRAEFKTLNLLK